MPSICSLVSESNDPNAETRGSFLSTVVKFAQRILMAAFSAAVPLSKALKAVGNIVLSVASVSVIKPIACNTISICVAVMVGMGVGGAT
jgi:hypothetical protein